MSIYILMLKSVYCVLCRFLCCLLYSVDTSYVRQHVSRQTIWSDDATRRAMATTDDDVKVGL
jgi:hypothetical protein